MVASPTGRANAYPNPAHHIARDAQKYCAVHNKPRLEKTSLNGSGLQQHAGMGHPAQTKNTEAMEPKFSTSQTRSVQNDQQGVTPPKSDVCTFLGTEHYNSGAQRERHGQRTPHDTGSARQRHIYTKAMCINGTEHKLFRTRGGKGGTLLSQRPPRHNASHQLESLHRPPPHRNHADTCSAQGVGEDRDHWNKFADTPKRTPYRQTHAGQKENNHDNNLRPRWLRQ